MKQSPRIYKFLVTRDCHGGYRRHARVPVYGVGSNIYSVQTKRLSAIWTARMDKLRYANANPPSLSRRGCTWT
jgi:hypothetical protein